MYKTYLPAIGFALTATLALPALAQTNPSIEGYEGGHVQAQTAFDTATAAPSFDASGNQEANINPGTNNPSLEGYDGNRPINPNALYGTLNIERPQYASQLSAQDHARLMAIQKIREDFARMEERIRNKGR